MLWEGHNLKLWTGGGNHLQVLEGDVVGIAVALHGGMMQQGQQEQQACLAQWALCQLLVSRAHQEGDGLDGQPQHRGCTHKLGRFWWPFWVLIFQ